MRRTSRVSVLVTVVALVAVAGCRGDSKPNDTSPRQSATAYTYGKCRITGQWSSFTLTPTTPGTLTVQTNLPSPGWWSGDSPETVDGGFEYCMAALIAHRTGLPRVTVTKVPFDALVAGRTDKFDIALAQISITDERKEVVAFSAPYFSSDIGVLAKKGSDVTAENIRLKRLGAATGQTGAAFLQEKISPGSPVALFPDTASLSAAVTSGQIDAAISDTAVVLTFAKQSAGALEVVGQYRTGEQYGALYPKSSTNVATINQIIKQLQSDGSLNWLSQRWLGPAFGGDPSNVPYFTISSAFFT